MRVIGKREEVERGPLRRGKAGEVSASGLGVSIWGYFKFRVLCIFLADPEPFQPDI